MDEFADRITESQIFILDKLFTEKLWQNVIDLYEKTKIHADTKMIFEFYYGLCQFNLINYEAASHILHQLDGRKAQLYATLADIGHINFLFRKGMQGNVEKLKNLLYVLDEFKDLKQYEQSEVVIGAFKIEAYYNCGFQDKQLYIAGIDEYNKLSDTAREVSIIRFYYALCLEMKGDRDEAINVYKKLEWKTDESIALRLMITLVLNSQSEEAQKIYLQLEKDARTIRTESIYLLAISKEPDYETKLKEKINSNQKDLSALLQIAYFTEAEKANILVLEALKNAFTEENLSKLEYHEMAQLLTYLAHQQEIEMCEKVLNILDDISLLNHFTVGEIVHGLICTCQRKELFSRGDFSSNPTANSIERIADMFLQTDIDKKAFLQIKIFCVNEKRIPYSLLKYSKELFEITHDMETARRIIGLLIERGESAKEEYEPYISVLRESDRPEYCMTIAHVLQRIGRMEEAEKYAYKALYLLNGEDDFEVYRLYFGYANNSWMLKEDRIGQDVVVVLEGEDQNNRVICLDSETDFTYPGNRSLGLEHLNKGDMEYLKIKTASEGQRIRIGEDFYTVKEILQRSIQCAGYVFQKIQQNPDRFPGIFFQVSTENPDEMIEQIRKITDRSEQTEHLLKCYHFEDNESGLPIECIGFNDYDKYIDVVRYLLFAKDEALYTGMFSLDNFDDHKYVVTLSTLVILGILNMLDGLDGIKEKTIIPESYFSFLNERYEKSLIDKQRGIKNLYFSNGHPFIQNADVTIPDIWERIINFCAECESTTVTDEERIMLKINEEISAERMMAGLSLNQIQLDALVLAKREDALYVSDDLFFRKTAEWIKLRHYNFASILLHYRDQNYIASMILRLSETNYLYLPIFGDRRKLMENFMSGKRKSVLYRPLIEQYYMAREKLLRHLFGDEVVDQASSDHEDRS